MTKKILTVLLFNSHSHLSVLEYECHLSVLAPHQFCDIGSCQKVTTLNQ